ncbi:hypothetical protein GW17_00056926 [Ensete ventricosum]|nr:hypothetical protein GW17_00056926 [Ensete ventricosum]RZS29191.1 hypothetical protein BHM03_00062894 [Ensete ventricosum]
MMMTESFRAQWFPSMVGIAKAETEEAKAEFAEQTWDGLKLLEEAFEKLSKGKAFFGGDTIGYVDIALGAHMGYAKVIEQMFGLKLLDEEKTPLLAVWAERFCAHEAVKEVMPETEKLMEFAKMFLGKLKESRAKSFLPAEESPAPSESKPVAAVKRANMTIIEMGSVLPPREGEAEAAKAGEGAKGRAPQGGSSATRAAGTDGEEGTGVPQ